MTLAINSLTNQMVAQEEFANISHCRVLLEKMTCSWHRRAQAAQVRQKVALESQPEMAFDAERDDFRTDLLPFRDHPNFLSAPLEMRKKILSYGWLAYNEKTVDIESRVIAPACNHILYKEVPGVEDSTSQLIASNTLVDEAYHIQLVVTACRLTRQCRQLEHLKLPSFNLVKNMESEKALHAEKWKKILVQVVTAIVSEVFVSDYLALLAHDTTIQPLNRLTVYTHFRDEKAHHTIFINLAKCIYAYLTPEQKSFFAELLPKPVRWFASMELGVWESMLQQINFPNAEHMMKDLLPSADVNLLRIDYSKIVLLAEELGILDSEQGAECFGRLGLLN